MVRVEVTELSRAGHFSRGKRMVPQTQANYIVSLSFVSKPRKIGKKRMNDSILFQPLLDD